MNLLDNMPIQYGELTVVHDTEQISFFSSLISSWLDVEYSIDQKSKILATFDGDDTIYEPDVSTPDHALHTKYEYTYTDERNRFPNYFKKKKDVYNKHYFLEKPTVVDDKLSINFKTLFLSRQNTNCKNTIPSACNCLYYCFSPDKKQVGLVRLRSSNAMPRFMFAYESEEFTKEEVVFLLYTMLTKERKS